MNIQRKHGGPALLAAFIALAAIQFAPSHKAPSAPQAATYRLLEDTPSGDEYVIDHGLSADDCGAIASYNAKLSSSVEFLCQAEG